jgi:sugar phosphate permease
VPLAAIVVATSWRGAFSIIGIVTLAGALACFLFVRDHPRGHAEASAPLPGLRLVLRGMMEVLGNRHTWPPFLVFFFVYSALQNLLVWCVPFLRDVYGLGTTRAAGYASAPSLALLVAAPLLGYLSDRILMRRKAPYAVLVWCLFATWTILVLTLGALPLWGLAAVLFAVGSFASAFVLTWPIAREVNPPHLAGTAVAVSNLGGFVGASLTQGPVGAMLDHRWTGAMLDGARVYPLDAYRAAFTACTLFTLAAAYFDAGTDVIGKPRGWGKEQQEKFEANDYHQPSDELRPDWELSGAVEDTQLLFYLGAKVANAPQMPHWKPGDEFEGARKKALAE